MPCEFSDSVYVYMRAYRALLTAATAEVFASYLCSGIVRRGMTDKRVKKTSRLTEAMSRERQPATLQSWRKLYKNRKYYGVHGRD